MTLNADSFGDLADLLRALGLAETDGALNEDWLANPIDYLRTILSAEHQREAFLRVIEDLLEEESEIDAEGHVWLPIVATDDGAATFYFVIDDAPVGEVHIGLGVRLKTTAPSSASSFLLPLFRTGKAGNTVSDPVLIGHRGGKIMLASEITVDPAPPSGSAGLRAIGLAFTAPTAADDGPPGVALTLGGLFLPGFAAPRDFALSISDIEQLDDAALDLILGIIQALAEGGGSAQISALGELLGLSGGVPSMPLDRLASEGPSALADWFASVVGNASGRIAWLDALTRLIGVGNASLSGDTLTIALGGTSSVDLEIGVVTGPIGRPVVTPRISFGISDATVRAEVTADLLRLDLGTGDAVAIPQLAAQVRLGSSASPLLSGDPGIQAMRAGLALNAARKPVPVLALDNVTIGSNSYPVLDLSSPDAIAETGTTVLANVISDLLAQLGPPGTAISVLLGIEAPAAAPGLPELDLAAFLADPLAAVRAHWLTLLTSHLPDVPQVLAVLRGLLAEASLAADPVTGTGTKADPWAISLVGPVSLLIRQPIPGTVELAIGITATQSELGERCTVLETTIDALLLRADLTAPDAAFAAEVSLRVDARGRGTRRTSLGVDPLRLETDRVSARLGWTSTGGLAFTFAAPNPALVFREIEIPLDVPDVNEGLDALSTEQWDALEQVLGLLAEAIATGWLKDLVAALGWRGQTYLSENDNLHRLRLADLVGDPTAEIRSWIGRLVTDGAGSLRNVLQPLARIFGGTRDTFGQVAGTGHPEDPFRIPVAPALGGPEIALWIEPEGVPSGAATLASDLLRTWRPGQEALDTASLADAMFAELSGREGVADAITQIADLRLGIEALLARLAGTDGLFAPPTSLPSGILRHVLPGIAGPNLREALDLADLLGAAPATELHIAVARETDDWPFPESPPDRRIDLRATSRAPETFAAPAPATGQWFIALAPRSDAALASGDPDGGLGQARRLVRILGAFSTAAGTVVAVADAASAHATWIAVNEVGSSSVNRLVTLGMAMTPASFSIFDVNPGAEALRLFAGLLPPVDESDPDDPDLAAARGVLNALAGLSRLTNPAAELSPPAAMPASVAGGVAFHAVYGRFNVEQIRTALTAVAAAGLSQRASAAAAIKNALPVTGAGLGIFLPIRAETGGLTISGHGAVDLAQLTLTPDPALSPDRSIRAHLEIRRDAGWLLGGPGTGPGAGQELRWIAIDVAVPATGSGSTYAKVRLHDARIFGIARDVWTLREAGAAVGEGVVTTALPEVRVLLSSAIAEILADTSERMVALADLLRSVGVIDETGGLVAAALDRLLHEPGAQVAQALQSAARQLDLQDAVDEAFAAIPGLDIDIFGKSVDFALTGATPGLGLPEWRIAASASASGPVTAELALGSAASGQLTLSLDPLSVSFDWAPTGTNPLNLQIWPNPDPARLIELAPPVATASLVKFGVDYMRDQDDTARLIIDGLLDLLGLLEPALPDGSRRMIPPAGLFLDPVAWLKSEAVFGLGGSGLDATRVVAAFDAFRPFLGLNGAPGRWDVADGVAIQVSGSGGEVNLALSLDGSAFTGTAERLAFGGMVGIDIGRTLVRPTAEIFVGLPVTTIPGRSAVHLSVDGELALFLRNAAGTDLSLYPNPPGLASLTGAAVETALPIALNAIIDGGGTAGAVTAAIGDALVLREGSPARFSGSRLSGWASDPEGELAARWPSISASALNALTTALASVLPTGVSASATPSGLAVAAGSVSLALETGPFRFAVGYADSGLPFVEAIDADLAFDGDGLDRFGVTVGPAMIDAGGSSLFPVFSLAAGPGVAQPFVGIGLAVASDGAQVLTLRSLFDPLRFEVVFDDGSGPVTDPATVASGLLTITLGLVVEFLRQTPAVQSLLTRNIPGSGSSTVEDLLEGVVLVAGDTSRIDTGLFQLIPTPAQDASDILENFKSRMIRLIDNFAAAGPSVTIDSILTIGLAKEPATGAVGVSVGLANRLPLTSGDIVVSLENDNRWIKDTPPTGIVIGILTTSPRLDFTPSIAVNGLGVRIGKEGAPLLDVGFSLGSIALHIFGRIGSGLTAGGVQVQLSDLAVGVTGGTGGNPIAQGIMDESGDSGQALAPAFSPALSIQKHGTDPVMVRLSAGEGDGPWWISIRKGFGPLYVDQVGLGVTQTDEELQKISLLFDGNISIAGLTAAVDDLQLTYSLDKGPVYDPTSWSVDLAGLAVSADLSGVSLAGGLRKYVEPGHPENVEYVGMLLARFAAYGLSIYGGYASIEDSSEGRYTAFFAYGAIVGPIGGPPAFFLTGIGGGFGINREIIVPDDLGQFDDFVMIKALDPNASPSSDPLAEMDQVRASFPAKRDNFWFAAGISFTSFAVVEGIAVVAVEFGNGFELNIFGLARMALPRPQFRLVSIELALVARFSTEEGVIWIQAQLTDNSWLLHPSVRLTGGFAFVSWFAGPKKGEFVLTLGGYHPSFHRDGYPVVPRLGFHWQPISNIVIKGENYFALTSEAIMAGGGLEASATFGPAWAHVSFGANVIIYFDPFRYQAEAHARISAGVTVKIWFAKVTISISLGAKIFIEGPEFRGVVTFEVGPVELTVAFGDRSQSSPNHITWSDFVVKYLEEGSSGTARALSAISGNGSLPPGGEKGSADGTPAHPFEVLSEFEMTVTTTIPADKLKVGTGSTRSFATSMALGLPPVNASLSASELHLSLKRVSTATERINDTGITVSERNTGNFPAAVWGPQQELDKKKLPKGEVISALEGAHMVVAPKRVGQLQPEIDFNQVEAGPRKPLPFVHEKTRRTNFLNAARNLRNVLPDGLDEAATFAASHAIFSANGMGATALAAQEHARVAPSRLGSLGERLAAPERETNGTILKAARPREFDRRVRPPQAIAILAPEIRAETAPMFTSVSQAAEVARIVAPTMAAMQARLDTALPFRLERVEIGARNGRTIIAQTRPPITQSSRGNTAFVRGLGQDAEAALRLKSFEAEAMGRALSVEATGEGELLPGEIVIFDMPASRRSDPALGAGTVITTGGRARVTALALGGAVLETSSDQRGRVALPGRTSRIVIEALRSDAGATGGVTGWFAEQELAYAGWSSAFFAGGLVTVSGATIPRLAEKAGVGWIAAGRLSRSGLISTRFERFAPVIAVLLDGTVDPEAAGDFALSLNGAKKTADEPVIVSLGARTVLIFRIELDGKTKGGPVSLAMQSEGSGRLAGVIASNGSAEALADTLTRRTLEDIIARPVALDGMPVRVTWRAPRKNKG